MSKAQPAFDSGVLMKAVERRHSDDLVIPECKNGPTQSGSHRRFDAWVLVRTWSPITTIGYEVKVSRSDWRRDEKLADYQGLCHLLYIVAPKGVVPVEEVPEGVGLLEAVGDGTRLVTRRKASRREIELPAKLMVYILMARVAPKDENEWDGNYQEYNRRNRAKQIREWAEGKDERRQLSWSVSQKIREKFDMQERALAEAERKAGDLQDVKDRMLELGFDPAVQSSRWKVSSKLREMAGAVGNGLGPLLEHTISQLRRAHDEVVAIQSRSAA
jgi:hypothetical protein